MSDSSNDADLRARAIHRIRAKQGFWYALVSWIVFSAFFVLIWALSGAGYFWPAWPIAAWAIGLVFTAVRAFGSGSGGPSETRIRDEMNRLQ